MDWSCLAPFPLDTSGGVVPDFSDGLVSHREYWSGSRRGKRCDGTGTKLLTQLLCSDLCWGVFQTILRRVGVIIAVHAWIGGHVGLDVRLCSRLLEAIRTEVLNSINLYLKFLRKKYIYVCIFDIKSKGV